MYFLKKFTKKKETPLKQEEVEDNSGIQTNGKKKSSQQVQFPIKKAIFPSIYSQQIKHQEFYQEGMKIVKNLQDITEKNQGGLNQYTQERVSKLWKDIDRIVQKLEGSQLCNQIKLLFYQYINQTLSIDNSAIDFIQDELEIYDENRYSLIQFLLDWKIEVQGQYTSECSLSTSRGLQFLKSNIDTIKSSQEIACFLNCCYLDILKPLGYNVNQQNQEIKSSVNMIQSLVQENICLNILETVLFIYNFQLYVPFQIVYKHFPQVLQQEKCKQDQVEFVPNQMQNKEINSKMEQNSPNIFTPLIDKKTLQINTSSFCAIPSINQASNLKIEKQNFSNDTQEDQQNQIERQYQQQLSSLSPQSSFERIRLNQSYCQIQQPINTVYPFSYTIWQEYEIVKGLTNYKTLVTFFCKAIINFSVNQAANNSISVKSASSSSSSTSGQQNDIQKVSTLLKSYFYLYESEKMELLNVLLSLINNLNSDINQNKFKYMAQLILFFITSDEVDHSHKYLLYSNQKVNNLLKYFQYTDQLKIVYNPDSQTNNDITTVYQPLLDFQSCVIKNGKTSKVHINPRSKLVFYADIFEQLSIINLSVGILSKDIKISIKYHGPFYQDNSNTNKLNFKQYPTEMLSTEKILIDQSPYRINFIAQEAGIYTIEFINSYSWFASKELEFRINILSPFQVCESSQSRQKTNEIFPQASKPFHQKAVEQFQRIYEMFNNTSDQALLIIENNTLRILYRSRSDKKENIVEIFKSDDSKNIFCTLEPQVINSLNHIINQRYSDDSKQHFQNNSGNKLALFVVIENEQQREYFEQGSLFQLIISHNFPSSSISIETYPNVLIQTFLKQKQIFQKQKNILFWIYNNNLYKSNNYEAAQLVENDFDPIYQISKDFLQSNIILVITRPYLSEINQISKNINNNQFQRYHFIFKVDSLFQ